MLPFNFENSDSMNLLHINLRHKEKDSDKAPLPTANTCINRLYLPRYESREVLRGKLKLAIQVKSFGFI